MVTAQTEAAIERGVNFLVKTQGRDGSWRTRVRYGTYPVAMTALAGLALMSHGSTPVEGPHAGSVRRAVNYVLNAADPKTGLIARVGEEQRPMYAHGYGMLFLAEAYGMDRDPTRQQRIKEVLQKAVMLTARSQSDDGGWYYSPESRADEGSVTIVQMQGLRACRNAGIHVPKSTVDRAVDYIRISQNPDGGIRYTARGGGGSREALTAQAIAVMYNAGQYDHPVAQKAMDYVQRLLTNRGSAWNAFGGHRYYGLFYCAQAMFLSSDEHWQSFYPDLRESLLRQQNTGNGAWDGDGVGETYGTAKALMILNLPYRHLPIFQR